ncbi:MAG: GntR family transcriptional regulator [Gallionellaceae bacterium]|nr:GntR family transcriptional regulator [Gallionellaceae bacterium]
MRNELIVQPELADLVRLTKSIDKGFPKHVQLSKALLAAIEAGHWKAGDKLPPEVVLARLTPFSLGTIQRALRALVDEGILIRRQGSGTFVTGTRKAVAAPWHCRFYADDGKGFLPVFPKVISRRKIRERGPWSDYLQHKGDNIIRIDRRMSINHEFIVFSKFYLNADHFGGMLKKTVAELDGVNFKTILEQEFGSPVMSIAQTATVMRFKDVICRACRINTGSTGLFLQSVASTLRGRNIYYQEFFVPPTSRRLMLSDHYDVDEL